MSDNRPDKFEILRRLAVDGSAGDEIDRAAQKALKLTVEYVGLSAASLLLWNEKLELITSVTFTESEDHKDRLLSLEDELLKNLRKDKKLLSAYLSFGGETPVHLFSLPLQYRNNVMGAVIGLQEGEKTIVAEDIFLETLSAMLAIVYMAGQVEKGDYSLKDMVDKERLAAINETAITVNHEVNNPLTAILGNVQLLLLKRDDLDDDLKDKLKVIEQAAMNIKGVTQKLLRLTSPKTKEYTEGTSMLDLSDEEE